jgi:hypothetical protein
MKCPACGFDTPDTQSWCDFCKEPFRKKADSAPAPRPDIKAKVDIPPAVLAKLLKAKDEVFEKKDAGPIPSEFLHLDTGGKIGGAPPYAKKMAWVFVAIIFVWTGIGLIWLMGKTRRIKEGRALPLSPFLLAGDPDMNAEEKMQRFDGYAGEAVFSEPGFQRKA